MTNIMLIVIGFWLHWSVGLVCLALSIIDLFFTIRFEVGQTKALHQLVDELHKAREENMKEAK